VTGTRILLDEHVGRVFERLLRERGHGVEQAKDRFGEYTSDAELLAWCSERDVVLLTNNAKDFEPLHGDHDHAGILLYYEQPLPDADPEGLARAVDEVFDQYGTEGVENRLVDLGEWYEWLQG
jgi:streptomycin 6-kinase